MIPGPRRILSIMTTLLIVVVVGVIGYSAVTTVFSLRNPFGLFGGDGVARTVREAIHPTPTIFADPVSVVLEIQNLSRLETASYTIEKVITAESGTGALGFLFRDKLLLVAHGQVIAGVDMSKMSEDDIIVSGTDVFVTLPAAEVFVATLDNEQTYIYERRTAVFGREAELETLARQEAQREIEKAALEDGILQKAQDNAEAYIISLMKSLGFERVTMIRATPTAPN